MKIPINKDIDEEYKDQLALGFSMKELGWILLAVVLIGAIGVSCWKVLGLTPEVCFYIGIPFGAIPIVVGFKKFQGQTFIQYLKELNYEFRTKDLIYDADELPHEIHVYSLRKEGGGKRK